MKYIIVLFLFSSTSLIFPDSVPYSDIKEISIESENYKIIHFHNWSNETLNERYNMITSEDQNILVNNNYAYINVINKYSMEIVLKIPSPALTHMYISEDERYIVGISNIMIDNPFQLIIIDIHKKEIIKKRHIASEEAKLNEIEFILFKNNFPKALQYLQSRERIYLIRSFYYIDFLSMNMPIILGNEAFRFLLNYITYNHLSNNISETVTNWVFWFNEINPNVYFYYRNNELYSINILDRQNSIIEILINEN